MMPRLLTLTLTLVLGVLLSLAPLRPTPATAQAGPAAVRDLLMQVRNSAVAVDEQQRALRQLLQQPDGTGDAVQQFAEQAVSTLLTNITVSARVIGATGAVGDNPDLFNQINQLAILSDTYTFAVVQMLGDLQQQAYAGASIETLRATAADDADIVKARADLVDAFNRLAATYGVDPLPTNLPTA